MDNEGKINNLKSKDEVGKVISDGIGTYRTTFGEGTPDMSSNSAAMQRRYSMLLDEKVLDENMKKEIIKHSKLVLRDRVSMKVTLTDGDHSGVFVVAGVLPEYEDEIKNYFAGITIHYQLWLSTLTEFEEHMTQIGRPVRKVYSEIAIDEDLEVKQIIIRATLQ